MPKVRDILVRVTVVDDAVEDGALDAALFGGDSNWPDWVVGVYVHDGAVVRAPSQDERASMCWEDEDAPADEGRVCRNCGEPESTHERAPCANADFGDEEATA